MRVPSRAVVSGKISAIRQFSRGSPSDYAARRTEMELPPFETRFLIPTARCPA